MINHFLNSFTVENAQLEHTPGENDLREIKKVRHETCRIGKMGMIVCLGMLLFVGYSVMRYMDGEISAMRLFLRIICLLSLIGASVCLTLYNVAIWLWANRDAGLTVICSPRMPSVLMDLLDNTTKIAITRWVAITLTEIGVMAALLPVICPTI